MNAQPNGRILEGTVVSDKMNSTIVVTVPRTVTHPIYKKVIKKTTKVHAHDRKELAKIGDKVRIQEVSPISKTKSWTLLDVIEKAN